MLIFAAVLAYTGEIISIGVALCWTIASLWSEVASKSLGVRVMNAWRMGLSVLMSAVMCHVFLGSPWPVYADASVWGLLSLSGFIGFFLGDVCLLGSYVIIGARTGQLFQTLAPAFSALFAWLLMGQTLGWKSLLAMAVTLAGIGITILGGGSGHGKFSLRIPLRGVLLATGAALGQGLGLVISGIGMNHYISAIPAERLPEAQAVIPFSANMIRCIDGFAAALLALVFTNKLREAADVLHSRRSLAQLAVIVVFGPVVGVGFSLMALRYTAAGIASTLQSLTPIMLLLPSHWMFGEKLTLRAVAGAIVSVAGVSLFFLL